MPAPPSYQKVNSADQPIIYIGFAMLTKHARGSTPLDAIYKGCLVRFHPIRMTTMARVFIEQDSNGAAVTVAEKAW